MAAPKWGASLVLDLSCLDSFSAFLYASEKAIGIPTWNLAFICPLFWAQNSQIHVHQNHLESLLKYGLLGLTSRVPDSVGPGQV